jgi:hypothetical protein
MVRLEFQERFPGEFRFPRHGFRGRSCAHPARATPIADPLFRHRFRPVDLPAITGVPADRHRPPNRSFLWAQKRSRGLNFGKAGSARIRRLLRARRGSGCSEPREKSIRQVAAHGSPRSLEMRRAVETEFGSLPRFWMKAP